MNQAVRASLRYSKDKDVVLFSPGCASKDWFKNFEDRGNQFKNIVIKMYEKIKSLISLEILNFVIKSKLFSCYFLLISIGF